MIRQRSVIIQAILDKVQVKGRKTFCGIISRHSALATCHVTIQLSEQKKTRCESDVFFSFLFFPHRGLENDGGVRFCTCSRISVHWSFIHPHQQLYHEDVSRVCCGPGSVARRAACVISQDRRPPSLSNGSNDLKPFDIFRWRLPLEPAGL